jgi:hypothetical protein
MKYKTLFRMLLKVIAVWLFVDGLSSLLMSVGYAFMGVGDFYFIFGTVSALAKVGFGLYLFFGGKWIADKAIPGNRPYCHECGYDLTNAAGNVCTECGTPFRSAEMSSAP